MGAPENYSFEKILDWIPTTTLLELYISKGIYSSILFCTLC